MIDCALPDHEPRHRSMPVAPYTCTAEVWDRIIDVAFPDD